MMGMAAIANRHCKTSSKNETTVGENLHRLKRLLFPNEKHSTSKNTDLHMAAEVCVLVEVVDGLEVVVATG